MRHSLRTLLMVTLLTACANTEAENQAFLDAAAAEPGAEVTASGLVYLEMEAGTGAQPLLSSDTVVVEYVGRLTDGTLFDDGSIEIRLNQVISCWTEGVAKMAEGGRSKLTCPPSLAYGASGSGPIPGNAVLVFEVKLIDVVGR
ncbi:MAG: FKBP-type peptidyl-prolyl cis-trans isomerase [Myxococcota bacterium]|nr:FKBP-type peptidyl-prolyl cis-trans isomerase [Myxococcota bacterium]